ncbi:hypothetical protein R5W24_004972 [Gemmata sp. JC717]|uniref:hypothetical protein n=1 Tax=Gemmata algarum TaxID=2975278 RepID=UPI0021BB06E0|nr:hypothetical protein [Gemmata algarum]MDY3555826.1 hypothetical protein [Gemmata algarum]
MFADLEITPRFWELVGSSSGDGESMRSVLMGCTREDLIRFETEFDNAVSDLVYRVIGDHGDAYTEQEVAGWVISRGLAFFAEVWDQPGRFPAEVPDEGANFYGMAGSVLEERFPGQPVTTAEPYRITFWPKARGSAVLP